MSEPPVMLEGMAGQIMSGFGYRGGVHFRDRAAAMGFGVREDAPNLWVVVNNGVDISDLLDTNEVHGFLDSIERRASAADQD